MMAIVKENIVKAKSFEFSLADVHLYNRLVEQEKFLISKQLLKAETNISANIMDAQVAQSKTDIIAESEQGFQTSKRNRILVAAFAGRQVDRNRFITGVGRGCCFKKTITSIVEMAKENLISSASNIQTHN